MSGTKTQHTMEAERLLAVWHELTSSNAEWHTTLQVEMSKQVLMAAQVHATLANSMRI